MSATAINLGFEDFSSFLATTMVDHFPLYCTIPMDHVHLIAIVPKLWRLHRGISTRSASFESD